MKPIIYPQDGRLYKPRLNWEPYRIRYRGECFFHSLKRFRAIESLAHSTVLFCRPHPQRGVLSAAGRSLLADR